MFEQSFEVEDFSCMEYFTPALSYFTTEMWLLKNLHAKMHNNQNQQQQQNPNTVFYC